MDQDIKKEKYEITQIKGGTDNCYLVSDGKNAILFDTSSGASAAKVIEECSKYEMKLLVFTLKKAILLQITDFLISEWLNCPVIRKAQ